MIALLRRILALSSERHIGLISAGVAFFAMLAVFPALAAVVGIWGIFADPAVVAEQMEAAADFLPPEGYAIVEAQISALVRAGSSTLGWATAVTVGAALWSARAGVSAIVSGINAIFGLPPRGGISHQITSLALTLALVGVALVAMAAGIVVPLVLAFVPLGPLEALLIRLVRWSIAPLVIIAGIGLVYRHAPNTARRLRFLSPGLAIAVALWVAASEGFSIYLGNFGNYNQVYGSIGAVAALLMWFYISAYAILLGAAVNAALD